MKFKVCQCWDDGVYNDIRLTELLRKYGAKATFNLMPGRMGDSCRGNYWKTRDDFLWSHHGFRSDQLTKKDIAEVYKGFEIASHCWTHENAGFIPDGEWIEAALHARHYLEDIVQKPCRGFAWPCGRFTPETINLLRENDFAYGRTVQTTDDVLSNEEPLALKSNCHFLHDNFWEAYNRAKANGGVFYFWGHSYEMMEYEPLWARFEDCIRTISEDEEAEWIDVVDLVPLLKKNCK